MKKIFAILSIVLIFFISIVPAFALTPSDNYLLSLNLYSFADYHVEGANFVTASYLDLKQDHQYYVKAYSPQSTPIDFENGLNFYLNNNSTYYSFLTVNTPQLISISSDSTWNLRLVYYNHTSTPVDVSFMIIDVTDFPSSWSATDFTSYFSEYGLTYDTYFGSRVLYPKFGWQTFSSEVLTLNPFFSFYSSIGHVFDYFPQLISSYSYPFVFVVGILFVLVMIFVISLVIRRCRNV